MAKSRKNGNGGRQLQLYEEERPIAVNEYYISLSHRFRIVKFAVLIALVVFLILMLGKYRDSITYNNFKYFIRDFDTLSSVGSGESFLTVRYDAQSNMRFAVFKNQLAVVGSSKISLYNSTGSQTLSETVNTAKPVISASDKYMIVYDLGGYKLTLYNSFTKVLERTYDYPIYGAEICDGGAFAVLTRSIEAKYEIIFSSEHFTPAAKYYKNKYVIDIALKSGGDEIAILSADSVGGDFSSEIMACSTSSDKVKFTYTIDNSYPIAAEYLDGGNLFVLLDNKIIFYDSEGIRIQQYDISGRSPVCMDSNGKRIAVIISTSVVNNESDIMIFDTDGNILYNNTINIKVNDVSVSDDRLYILSTSTALRVSDYQYGAGKAVTDEVSIPGRTMKILALYDDGREPKKCAIICTDTGSFTIFDEIARNDPEP